MARQKKTMLFYIDEIKVYNYMLAHNIRYLKDFYMQAGLSMVHVRHCKNHGILSLEHAWKLAEFMGCMIEDIIIAEYIEEEK